MKRSSRSLFKVFCLLIGFCVVCSSAYAGFETVDYPEALGTVIQAINNYGVMVGQYALSETSRYGFVYDPTQPVGTRFSTVDLSSYITDVEASIATGINDFGTVVGFYMLSGSPYAHGFMYVSGIPVSLDYPGAEDTFFFDINNSGVVVGFYRGSASGQGGFLYDPTLPEGERFQEIIHPGEYGTQVFGLNDSGFLVGSYGKVVTGPRFDGFIYTVATETFDDFDIPEDEEADVHAFDINDFNLVAGVYNTVHEGGQNHGFIYDPSETAGDQFTFFDYPNGNDTTATGINNDSYIVGSYRDLVGVFHGFLYTPDSILCEELDNGAIDIMGQAACASDTLTIRVPIRIQNAYKPDPRNAVDAFGFEVTYDPAVLTFVEFERGDLLLGFDDVVEVIDVDHNEVETGVVRIGGFTTVNKIRANQEGILGYLVFYPNQAVSTKLDIQNMVDDIAHWPASGACLTPATGDINLDGEVTPADALCAFEKAIDICATTCGPCETTPCDVDQDCQCTASDSLCMFNKYLGIPSCLDS